MPQIVQTVFEIITLVLISLGWLLLTSKLKPSRQPASIQKPLDVGILRSEDFRFDENGEPMIEIRGWLDPKNCAVSSYYPERPTALEDRARAIQEVEQVLQRLKVRVP